jgi:amino acid permease
MQNKKDFNKVIIIGMSIISLILIGFPIIAYFAYQNDTGEVKNSLIQIILQNLPIEKVFIQIVLLLLIFSIIVVYPVVLNPAFRILEFHFIKCQQNAILWQNILRTSLVFITVVVGVLSIGKFDNLLSLVGCAVCTPIALIFPSLFHYKLYKDKQGWLRTFLDLFITIIGVLTSLIILIFTLINWNARKE